MCEPTTMLALTAAAGVMSAVGQIQAGNAAKAEADFRAKVAESNAQRAQLLANDAIERGKEDEARERIRGRLLLGQMRAVLGGSGQVVDTGSAGDLVVDQAEVNEQDALTVRNNAAREAQEFRIQGADFSNQASLQRQAGANAQSNSRTAAFGTILGSGAKVANKWYEFDRAGAWD